MQPPAEPSRREKRKGGEESLEKRSKKRKHTETEDSIAEQETLNQRELHHGSTSELAHSEATKKVKKSRRHQENRDSNGARDDQRSSSILPLRTTSSSQPATPVPDSAARRAKKPKSGKRRKKTDDEAARSKRVSRHDQGEDPEDDILPEQEDAQQATLSPSDQQDILPDENHDISLTAPTSIHSPFYTQTSSLYVPIPAIGQSPQLALPSVVTAHLAPLLLTYYPPLGGVVLAFARPSMRAQKPEREIAIADQPNENKEGEHASTRITPNPTPILAPCPAEEEDSGSGYVWLQATFLLFRPQRGDELYGYVNVCSEGFIGLLCYNYFAVSIGREQIPADWKWMGSAAIRRGGDGDGDGEVGEEVNGDDDGNVDININKENDDVDNDYNGADAKYTSAAGNSSLFYHFVRADNSLVRDVIRFRVLDCEMIPGHERGSWSLQIEGSLLDIAGG